MMQMSLAGRQFLCSWESCLLTPYQDIAGNWTVGWGHELEPTDARDPVTQDEADALLDHDLLDRAVPVNGLIRVTVTQPQFDAIMDFCYNAGIASFTGSTARRELNAGNPQGCADKLLLWNKARDPATGNLVVSAGLSRRRAAERNLFLHADYSGNA